MMLFTYMHHSDLATLHPNHLGEPDTPCTVRFFEIRISSFTVLLIPLSFAHHIPVDHHKKKYYPLLDSSLSAPRILARLIFATGCRTHSLINHIHIMSITLLKVKPFTIQI